MGLMMFDPVWAERMHVSGTCEMLHVIDGTLELVMQGASYVAGPGQTLLVPPNTMHRDQFDLDRGLEVFYASFVWPMAEEFFSQVDNDRLLNLPAGTRADLSAMVDHLRGDLAGRSEIDGVVARSRLLTLLLTVLREVVLQSQQSRAAETEGGSTRRRELMGAARAYLQEHYAQCIALDDVASALGVSPYYLSHVFSDESEASLFAYLTNLRMDKARTLLLEGKRNVSEVARAVGYESANYFSKVFRKHAGCAPRDYAASVRGNAEA